MTYTETLGFLSLGLFVGILVCLEVGAQLGKRRSARESASATGNFAAIEGAVFALLGLLLAFTFSGAATRFDARRQLIVEETNAIGTAYLRLDMLPSAAQPALRQIFRRYVNARLAVYQKIPDRVAVNRELVLTNEMQKEIWQLAVAAVRSNEAPPQAALLLLPALNAMIDITTTRAMAAQMHPPMVIFVLIYVLALVSALLAGYALEPAKSRSWLHRLCFAAVIAIAVYVIQDIEYPRFGLIRVDAFDQALKDLRESMK